MTEEVGGVEVRTHAPGQSLKAFLRAGHVVFEGDPNWIPPLAFDLKQRLDPKKNPAFEHTQAMYFTAWRDGQIAGRITASVDQAWRDYHGDRVGHFGFFDTVDDPEVACALMHAAEVWLREQGTDVVLGPMSLTANEEIGLLVDGFDTPPSVMMAHSRPYQGALVEACGYEKEKDLYCWRFDQEIELKARTTRAWEAIQALPEITLRSVNMKRLKQELAVIVDIYNEAWDGKWGFVPVTEAEVEQMAEDLSLVLDPDIAFVAELDGEPVAMCIMVPNLNEAIHDLEGALFPFGWAKLLWRLKVQRVTSTRLILLGIRGRVRKNVKRYGGLAAAMMVEVRERGIKKGYTWSELSWTREDDAPINLGIRSMGARVYKTYRVYRKRLD
ncbi:MAG: hypothetical protein AB8I08_20035 [Sandaracinaceae bacterium]